MRNVGLTQLEAVIEIEKIARICNCEPLLIDQILLTMAPAIIKKQT